MIVIEGTVRMLPENIDKARPAMERMIQASRAETGCIDYAYSIDLMDPGLVRITERWETREALAAHSKTAHMTEWRSRFAALGISDRDLRLYEADPESI